MPPGDAKYHRPLNIFFDVDDTLISWESRLRPHVHAVFQQLKEDGHVIYVWSGVGLRHDVVERNELAPYVSGVYRKPLYDFRARLREFTPVDPDFVVDDYPEIVEELGGVQVRPPVAVGAMAHDEEMWRVYEAFAAHVRALPPAE